MKTLLSVLNGPRSLKNTLIVVLLASTLIPLALVGAISYYAIYSILDHKIEDGIRSNLSQTKQSLEASLNHLKSVSQQLSLDGSVGQNLSTYLTTDDLYEKKVMRDRVIDELNLITFSNPNLGMVCYYLPREKRTLFANYCPVGIFDESQYPVFAESRGFTFYGPYAREDRLNDTTLAISREVQTASGELFIYIETRIPDFFFGGGASGGADSGAGLLVVDRDGAVTHSDSAKFRVGSLYAELGDQDDVYLFADESDQGWSLVSVIPKAYYNREINEWLVRFVILGASSLGVCLLLAWAVWRTVYKPLRGLSHEIMLISRSHLLGPIRFTDVKEFDFLLLRFHDMRTRIRELLAEVREKEQRKASLEVEKLMYQINPHFTHNTLDTIRWLARMEGHAEIDRLVSTLNKVLYYNLGKGRAATIEDELSALRHYVALQQIRYNFQFDVRIETDETVGGALIPRFILQPLVENALYHGGLADEGAIWVSIARDGDGRIGIRVTDNGSGMDKATIDRLMDLDGGGKSGPVGSGRAGLGIGINYVRRMIEFQYGGRAEFRIESEIGQGTSIVMRIPYEHSGDGAA